jgi:predicted transcriptional regulator
MRISEWHEKKIADDPDYAQAVALVSLTQDLADVIVNLRVKLSMSQAELARRAGTTQAVISRLENGDANPTVDMVRRVVNALVETATAQAAAR